MRGMGSSGIGSCNPTSFAGYAGRMDEDDERIDDDDRPPICPACGVTMGIIAADDGTTHHVCLECGFPDEQA